MRINAIIPESIVDGPGVRTTVFVQGCYHNCPGCHNQHTHDVHGGEYMSVYDLGNTIINKSKFGNVTISGGDPLYQAKELTILLKRLKYLKYNIWVYTGFTYEEILDSEYRNVLKYIDVLVDGKYKQDLRDISLRFRGSTNQRIIDVQESLCCNDIIIYNESEDLSYGFYKRELGKNEV